MFLEFDFNFKQHMITAETSILIDKEYKLEMLTDDSIYCVWCGACFRIVLELDNDITGHKEARFSEIDCKVFFPSIMWEMSIEWK